MSLEVLLVIHVATLGYWLGAELVINSTSRYVCRSRSMPMDERTRLMHHVMNVDQHVRYAMVIQLCLGFAIAASYGYVPGGAATAMAFAVLGVLWLAYVEITHRLRLRPIGKRLAALDRLSRYIIMAILVGIAVGLIGGGWAMPYWLRLKLALFGAVMACGVAIRLAVISRFRAWAVMTRDGPSDEMNAIVWRTYLRSTSVIVLLWIFISMIVVVSIWKPA